MNSTRRSAALWVFAFFLTLATVYYQRVTGPTYPLSGKVVVNGKEFFFKLDRSHGGETNAVIKIQTNDSSIHGLLTWKKYKTNDEWTEAPMRYENGILSAELPHQPPAGKLMYRVALSHGRETISATKDEPVVIRFKGDVPLAILIPHVIAMFGAMLLSTRTGLEYFAREQKFKALILWTIGFLFAGGIILGPIVQLFAFDALWTGWPLGTDLTDNKTAIALLAWLAAYVALRKSTHARIWVAGAAIVTFIVYLIPHSLFGSELDYNAKDAQHPPIENTNGK